MKWGNREAETDIPLFSNLIMSGKCQRFGHVPQWSSGECGLHTPHSASFTYTYHIRC